MSKSNNGNWHSFIMVIMRFLICVLWIGSWILFLPSGEIMSKKVKAPKFCSWRKNNHYQAWRLKPFTTPAPGDPNWNHISLCITSSLIHQSWPKNDQDWPRLTKSDQDWQRLTKNDRDWAEHPSWRRTKSWIKGRRCCYDSEYHL